tara:strand:+ start:122 stop:436 length:315 start_codon:yes stop_codon:yes gene_type:complete
MPAFVCTMRTVKQTKKAETMAHYNSTTIPVFIDPIGWTQVSPIEYAKQCADNCIRVDQIIRTKTLKHVPDSWLTAFKCELNRLMDIEAWESSPEYMLQCENDTY